ncbi:hypothetical protein MKZ38_005469 [Zalerion maritima]|uniref:Uncharacterized protein n=1 Tax=Zalerion maritima TaxID=339359 RepID=A0AAD5RKD9_9PEZI|nr:hypothetical protein MKZ38_005469 [Zalerion maritima]
MAKNKNRLALAVYSCPEQPGTFNYALIECPKNISEFQQGSPMKKWQIRNFNMQQTYPGYAPPPPAWGFEAYPSVYIQQEANLLVLVVIGKVQRFSQELEQTMREVQIPPPQQQGYSNQQYGYQQQQQNPNFNSITWTESAVQSLHQRGMATDVPPWFDVDSKARQFVNEESAKGRWNGGFAHQGRVSGVPVLDLVDGGKKDQRLVTKDDGITCGCGVLDRMLF